MKDTVLDLHPYCVKQGDRLAKESAVVRATGVGPGVAADFFACYYEPRVAFKPGDDGPRRRKFIAGLLESPEFHALHDKTMWEVELVDVATASLCEQYAKRKKKHPAIPGGRPIAGLTPEDEEEFLDVAAAAEACEAASGEVDEILSATAMLGHDRGGRGRATHDRGTLGDLTKRIAERLKRSDRLRRIVDQAGKFRLLARSRQSRKTRFGQSEVVGVEPVDELARALPEELARLAHPALKLDALRRFTENEVFGLAVRGVEPVGKGPILVTLDESGSMRGEKDEACKGLALAIAEIARLQKRWCGLVAYSGATGHRLLPLPPGPRDAVAVLDWLDNFIGGGSTLDVPLRELPTYYDRLNAPTGKTDLISITDACLSVPSDVRKSFRAWKLQAKVRATAIVIGSTPGDLADVFDETHIVASLLPTEDAVGRVLSL